MGVEPEHRSILAVDIEAFSNPARTNPERLRLRRYLIRLVRELLAQARITQEQYATGDTGDGLIVSMAPQVPTLRLLDPLLARLAARLAGFNRGKPEHLRLRLRVAVHAGAVLADPAPLHGEAVIHACRLLDSPAARACLAATGRPVAALVSRRVYDEVVRHAYGRLDPAAWHRVLVQVKETREPAWAHVPGDVSAPQRLPMRTVQGQHDPAMEDGVDSGMVGTLAEGAQGAGGSGLIGRDREWARLVAFLGELRAGKPAGLVIEGEAGIGKTALFDAAVAAATGTAGMQVLRARCVAAEAGLAYRGLADLLDPWAARVLPVLPAPRRRALEIAVGHAEAAPDQNAVEPYVVSRALAEVLRTLAASAPVLVAIDDVPWLDAASARTLTFALRRVEAAPVGVLATRRTQPPGGPLPLALDHSASPLRRQRLGLEPLDAEALAAVLERRGAEPLPRLLRRRVLAAAGGNPLYALELVDAQRRSGRPLADPLVLPAHLEELLADRLAGLPTAAAEPLAAIACLAVPTVALVTAALGAGARTSLDHALDAGVVQVQQGRLWFAHPLYGVAALTRVAPSRQRAIHARLGAAVTDVEQRAWHLAAATDTPDTAVAAAVEAGAERARARGAPEIAAELAEAAVRLTPPDQPDAARRRLIAAGYHRATTGEISRGRAHLAAALDNAPPGPVRADLRWRLAMLTHLDGDLDQAVRLLEAALAEADNQVALQATVATKLSGLYGWQGRLRASLAQARQALRWAETAGDPVILLDALTYLGRGVLYAGEGGAADLLGRIQRSARVVGRRPPHEDPDNVLTFAAWIAGDTRTATRRLEGVYQRAVELGDELALAGVPYYLLQVELAAGHWARARQLAQVLHQNAVHRNNLIPRMAGLHAIALVEGCLGNADVAHTAAAELVETASRHGSVPLVLEGQAVIGFVALSQGDPHRAHAVLGPLLERRRELGIGEPAVLPLAWLDLDALIELGELDQAAALAEELHEHGTRLDRPFALATAARGRGLIRAARGDLAGAHAEFDAALREHDRLGWPFERAQTLLALGRVLHHSRQHSAARTTLQDALAVFDGLGARLWSAKTTAELARIGYRTRRG